MFEIVVISGKGGTGKTSLTGAFAHLAGSPIICDLDVDAPDLHLLLRPEGGRWEEFHSGNEAVIRTDDCTACGLCAEKCRYGAIREEDALYRVDPLACEGCGLCRSLCPAGAIDFPLRHCGRWTVSQTRFGTMVHAELFPGQENSGRLVALLRTRARELAQERGVDLVLSDGPPGIGCPVISSLSGAGLAVVVTEPTPSGLHDLERVADLCGHFRIPVGVIVNKYDINPGYTDRIGAYCGEKGHTLLARLAYDPVFTGAMLEGKVVSEMEGSPMAAEVARAWEAVNDLAARSRKK